MKKVCKSNNIPSDKKFLKTNFLLDAIYAPDGTILGKKRTLELYRFAIKKKLRFFSYGDACLIWIGNGKI